MSFGFGIHRRVGIRLAELQLKIPWEEILRRFPMIEGAGEPKRIYANFIHGFSALPVRIPAWYQRVAASAAYPFQCEMQPALAVRDVALQDRAIMGSGELYTGERTG